MWRARALPAVPACREPSWCRSFTRVQASFNAKLVLLRLLRSLARSTALRRTKSDRFSPLELACGPVTDCKSWMDGLPFCWGPAWRCSVLMLHQLHPESAAELEPNKMTPACAILSAASQALHTVCRPWGFEHDWGALFRKHMNCITARVVETSLLPSPA